MRFALINNEKAEARPKEKALCPGCLKPVIAKCGTQKIHHWAHQNNKNCDSWWEPETGWHRTWKQNFPNEWQEVHMRDEVTNEIHIADVHTNNNVVIEFQHSHIDPQERIAREKFYPNLVWVVDGTRLKRDFARFLGGKQHFNVLIRGIYSVYFVEEVFPSAWHSSTVPVILDFFDPKLSDNIKERKFLYCLIPKKYGREAIIAEFSRSAFIKSIIIGDWLIKIEKFTKLIDKFEKERQDYFASRACRDKIQENFLKKQLLNPKKGRRF